MIYIFGWIPRLAKSKESYFQQDKGLKTLEKMFW